MTKKDGINFATKLDTLLKKQEVIDKLKNEYKYKVVYDDGKPFEVYYNTDDALFEGLKIFYDYNKGDSYFDCKIYNSDGEDISDSQFINEMVGEILNEN